MSSLLSYLLIAHGYFTFVKCFHLHRHVISKCNSHSLTMSKKRKGILGKRDQNVKFYDAMHQHCEDELCVQMNAKQTTGKHSSHAA